MACQPVPRIPAPHHPHDGPIHTAEVQGLRLRREEPARRWREALPHVWAPVVQRLRESFDRAPGVATPRMAARYAALRQQTPVLGVRCPPEQVWPSTPSTTSAAPVAISTTRPVNGRTGWTGFRGSLTSLPMSGRQCSTRAVRLARARRDGVRSRQRRDLG